MFLSFDVDNMIVDNNMATQTKNKIPSIEEQIEQSLKDLENGDYEDFTIPEYRAELRRRFGQNLDN